MPTRGLNLKKIFRDTYLVNELKEKGIMVYLMIHSIAEGWGGFEPDYNLICRYMNAMDYKEATIKETIKKLVENNMVFTYESEGRTYCWINNLTKDYKFDRQRFDSPPRIPLPEWVTVEQKKFPSGKVVFRYSILKDKLPAQGTSKLPEKKSKQRTMGMSAKMLEMFEKFWAAYPDTRKIGKDKALKAFSKIKPTITTDAQLEPLMLGLEIQKKYPQWLKSKDGEFIPIPATWLNQRRWLDDAKFKKERNYDFLE